MSVKNKYFLAAGKSLEAANSFKQLWREAEKRRNEFSAKHGCTNEIMARGSALSGVRFSCAAPVGFKPCSFDKSYFEPDKRTKPGREIAKEWKRLHMPCGSEFAQLIGAKFRMSIGEDGRMYIAWPTVEELNDGRFIIGIVHDDDFVPPDAIPLKMSEYWAMKEESQATDKATKEPEAVGA